MKANIAEGRLPDVQLFDLLKAFANRCSLSQSELLNKWVIAFDPETCEPVSSYKSLFGAVSDHNFVEFNKSM